MPRARSQYPALALCVTVEHVVAGSGHPQEGRFQAQARWDEETWTAYGDTAPAALLALACDMNHETWPGDTATARALDPACRVWPQTERTG